MKCAKLFCVGLGLLVSGLAFNTTAEERNYYSEASSTEPAAESCCTDNSCISCRCRSWFSGCLAGTADPCRVPNMIGDMGLGRRVLLFNGGGTGAFANTTITPAAGRTYKATDNNSPLPQSRVYYSYGYLENAQVHRAGTGLAPGAIHDIDVNLHEFGAEWSFWCDRGSVQVVVPFRNALDSTLDPATATNLKDTEIGNVAFAFKGLLYQNDCFALSAGLAVDIPTANDTNVVLNTATIDFTNDAAIYSPFIGWQYVPSECFFAQGFIQFSIPDNDSLVRFFQVGPSITFAGVKRQSLMNIDVGAGRWLRRDSCGNGIAVIGELHYTESLNARKSIFNGATNSTLVQDDFDSLNATFGATVVRSGWDITPAVVVPLLSDPNRFSDWAFAFQVNRRF